MSFSATFIYELLDRYSPALRKIASATDTFRLKSMYAADGLKKMGDKATALSFKLANFRTAIAAIGFTRGFKNITMAVFDFTKALNEVEAVTRTTPQGLAKLRAEALRLGATTIFTSGQVAQGMVFLGRTGLDVNEILTVMPGMLQLATAGNLQLAEASDIATNVLKTFGFEVSEMGRVTDVLALAAANSNTDIRQLAGAIRNVGPLAKGAGVSIEETAALIGILGDKGIQAGHAGTLLMNAFRNLAKETPKMVKGLKHFGFKREDIFNQAGHIKDFTAILETLGEKGATVGQLFNIFDIRGGKAVMALKDSAIEVRSLTNALKNAEGAGKKMADTMIKGLPGHIIRMQSAFDNMKISMGEAMKPAIIWMAELATQVSRFVSAHPALAKVLGTLLLIGSTVSTVVIAVGVLASLFGAAVGLATTIGLLVASIGFLTLMVVKHWDSVLWYLNRVWEVMKGIWVALVSPFKLVAKIFMVLQTNTLSFGEKIKEIGSLIKEFFVTPLQWALDKLTMMRDMAGFVFEGGHSRAAEASALRSSTGKSPMDNAAVSQQLVKVVIDGSIDVNDKTGRASIPRGGGGNVPVNLRPSTGYRGY